MKIRSYWFVGTKEGFETNHFVHPNGAKGIVELLSKHFDNSDDCYRWLDKFNEQSKLDKTHYVCRVDVTRESRNL